MKKALLISSLLLLFLLTSCADNSVSTVITTDTSTEQLSNEIFFPTDNSTEQTTDNLTTEDSTTEIPKEILTEPITYSSAGIPIENAYYSLYLPASWDGKYISDMRFADGNTMIMNFREITSADSGSGGLLFSIVLSPAGTQYDSAAAKKLYNVYSSDGSFELYADYPASLQYSEDTAAAYNMLAADIDTVLKTLTASGGCVFE